MQHNKIACLFLYFAHFTAAALVEHFWSSKWKQNNGNAKVMPFVCVVEVASLFLLLQYHPDNAIYRFYAFICFSSFRHFMMLHARLHLSLFFSKSNLDTIPLCLPIFICLFVNRYGVLAIWTSLFSLVTLLFSKNQSTYTDGTRAHACTHTHKSVSRFSRSLLLKLF